ncbi:uncharacterized protein K460DRAFT_403990 [Cucurbitaria berberidis CBS 394.84]|uniref:DUF6590 domain-containing protein n=1 Tax=Cucurbitaria berberidis CBS 394.84 TaxID=1168544 RepID=A0A9P4GLT2_9PLEO|nr:uncharacterized protein K460DRAFT_403990 [Cucurbitaria berberidis CBS 394.84]KAF1848718.1 hypothetical protein K460DRAFT_403990 [Cucurbitaria berberidis CBS 394.84]
MSLYIPWTWSIPHQKHYSYLLGSDGRIVDTLWSSELNSSAPSGEPSLAGEVTKTTRLPPVAPPPPYPAQSQQASQTKPSLTSSTTITSTTEPAKVPLGNFIRGTYIVMDGRPDAHYETFDSSFYARDHSFFEEGKIFAIILTEPDDQLDERSSVIDYGNQQYAKIRRLIVVQRKRKCFFAIPIRTYGKEGTAKPGVIPQDHSIAYQYGSFPQRVSGEEQLSNDAICLVMNNGESLDVASRINFGTHYPVEYNVKVKDLGYVDPKMLPKLLNYWRWEKERDMEKGEDSFITESYYD